MVYWFILLEDFISLKNLCLEKNGCLFAYDLYNQVTKIDMLLDLIMLNFDCWKAQKP